MNEEEEDEDEDEQESDDDTGFFPIDEHIVQSSQLSTQPIRTASEQSNKYSSGLTATNTHSQDNNFEYVGKILFEN